MLARSKYCGDHGGPSDADEGMLESAGTRHSTPARQLGGGAHMSPARIRTQTILFSDVVASTEVLADLDSESGEPRLRDHVERLRHITEHHGGRVVKTLGDGLLASFDAAANALDTASAIQRASHGLLIKVGISSGDVDSSGEDLHGLPVVEASRLCSHAAGGEVLASEATRLLASRSADLVDRGPVRLKGLPYDTGVWELRWVTRTLGVVRAVVAEDSVLIREGIARTLERAGIEVAGQAGDAEQLAKLVEDLRPDVALIDSGCRRPTRAKESTPRS